MTMCELLTARLGHGGQVDVVLLVTRGLNRAKADRERTPQISTCVRT